MAAAHYRHGRTLRVKPMRIWRIRLPPSQASNLALGGREPATLGYCESSDPIREATNHPAPKAAELPHLFDERLPLARIADPHLLVESGRAVGNVVLSVTD